MKGRIFIKVFDKRHLVLFLCIVIFVGASFYSTKIDNKQKDKINPSVLEVSKQDKINKLDKTIDEIKLNREIERSKVVEQIKELLFNSNNDNTKLLEEKLSQLADRSNKEMMCESIISSKGIADNVVLSSDKIVYVIADYNLSRQNVIQIQHIVQNIFGVSLNDIRITSLRK